MFYIRSGNVFIDDFEVFPIIGSETAINSYIIEKVYVEGIPKIHIQFTGTYQGSMDFLFIELYPESQLSYEIITE